MDIIKRIFKSREIGSFLFLIFLLLGVGCINPAFLKPTSIMNCFNDSVVFTLLAVGSAFVIITGEIDVSVGAILGISAAVASTLLRDGKGYFVAFVVAILIGAFIGFLNGVGVSYFKIPSLIFTLGTMGVVRGVVYVYTKGAWVENLPAQFTKASNVKVFGDLTYFYLITIIFVIVGNILLTKTKKGKYFTAVGDNVSGALLVGIPTTQTKIMAYVFSAVLSAVAGIVYSSRIGFITPLAGDGYEMNAIAACVLGGIALTGGQGNLIGAAIGAIIMSSISRILVFIGLSSDYNNTITGVLLITIVVITTVMQNRSLIKNKHNILISRTK